MNTHTSKNHRAWFLKSPATAIMVKDGIMHCLLNKQEGKLLSLHCLSLNVKILETYPTKSH